MRMFCSVIARRVILGYFQHMEKNRKYHQESCSSRRLRMQITWRKETSVIVTPVTMDMYLFLHLNKTIS